MKKITIHHKFEHHTTTQIPEDEIFIKKSELYSKNQRDSSTPSEPTLEKEINQTRCYTYCSH
jgi:hypothetical protein